MPNNRVTIVVAGALGVVALALAAVGFLTLARLWPPRTARSGSSGRTAPANTKVEGTVSGPAGSVNAARIGLVRVTTTLRPLPSGRAARGSTGSGFAGTGTTTSSDGRFTLNNVGAGAFWVVAHSEAVGAPPALSTHYWAIREITTTGRGTVTAPLDLQPGGTVTGRVVLQSLRGTSTAVIDRATITLVPADPRTQALLLIGNPRGHADQTGAFVIPAVAPGRYTMDVSALPDWSLDSAVVDGQDWMDLPIDIVGGGHVSHATVVFTDQPNVITGVVRHASGQPAAFVLVMAFSDDVVLHQAPRRLQAMRSGTDGRFAFSGLPTGRYRVAVANDLAPEDWYTPESLVRLAPTGTKVLLANGEPMHVTLSVR